jgi:hypothetical protein
MRTLSWTQRFAAPPDRVWKVMLDADTYRDWTSHFAEGSYYEGTWGLGAEIRFLAPGGSGMVSRVAEWRPGELLVLEHFGVIENGVVDTTSEAVKAWAPAHETYRLASVGAGCELTVTMEVSAEHEAYFQEVWPRALARLASLCSTADAG